MPPSPFRLEQCADDVAALARELGIARFVPVGYSMGGPIAQLIWLRHRELVDGLVLCATSARFSGTVRERVLFGVAAGTSVMAGAVPIDRLTRAALGRWNDWRLRRGGSWWGLEEVARHDWEQIVEAGRAIGRFDSRRWVGDVSVPTAVVVTEDDDVVPVRRQLALADRPAGRVGVARPRRPHRVHRSPRSGSCRRSSTRAGWWPASRSCWRPDVRSVGAARWFCPSFRARSGRS